MSSNLFRMSSRNMSKLTVDTINAQVVKAQYAVRGELVIKADGYRKQLASGEKLPFKKIISCNIGNPHDLGQKPITFLRQVLSICQYPEIVANASAAAIFPADVKARAQKYLSSMSSVGAYTHSQGLAVVRQEVADFVAARDGFATSVDNIFLTDGASSGVKMLLQTLVRNAQDGILCPIPQYPLYSATLALLNGQLTGYFLNEENGWAMDVAELQRAVTDAKSKGVNLRAIVIINPGNPTGQCLPKDNIEEIVRFCEKEDLVLLADEVYQENAYTTTPFTSFRQVVKEMKSSVPLVSFHSVSKGFLGECGQRGGYFHLTNFPAQVAEQLYKLASISLCSNVTGQLSVGLMVNPPKQGEDSFDLYDKEKSSILDSLKRRALVLAGALNKLEGVSCQAVQGALYAFPQITLPKKALEAAKAAGKPADTFYALRLLDATGICVVPGTGFGQVAGTFHYRTTILPSEGEINTVIEAVNKFHREFMNEFRD